MNAFRDLISDTEQAAEKLADHTVATVVAAVPAVLSAVVAVAPAVLTALVDVLAAREVAIRISLDNVVIRIALENKA